MNEIVDKSTSFKQVCQLLLSLFVSDCRLDQKKSLESAGRSSGNEFSFHSIYWFIQIFTILFSHCPQIAKAIV